MTDHEDDDRFDLEHAEELMLGNTGLPSFNEGDRVRLADGAEAVVTGANGVTVQVAPDDGSGWLEVPRDQLTLVEAFKSKADEQQGGGGGPRELADLPARAPRLLTLAEAREQKVPLFVVKPLLRRREVGFLIGAPSSFKTFLALDLAAHLACGLGTWAGFKVRPGRVLFCAGEGAAGILKRIDAWLFGRPPELAAKLAQNLIVTDGAFPLPHPPSLDLFIERARAKLSDLALVVVDTLNAHSAGLDESGSVGAFWFMEGCRRLATELEAGVLVPHHPLKNDPDVERGSGAFRGAADLMLHAARDDAEVTLKVTKLKDGQTPVPRDFTLEDGIIVGTDEDGEIETSCRLIPKVADPQASRAKYEPDYQAILRALTEADSELTYSDLRQGTGLSDSTLERRIDDLRNSTPPRVARRYQKPKSRKPGARGKWLFSLPGSDPSSPAPQTSPERVGELPEGQK